MPVPQNQKSPSAERADVPRQIEVHDHPTASGKSSTTNVYAEVDLEMKAKALATCEGKR